MNVTFPLWTPINLFQVNNSFQFIFDDTNSSIDLYLRESLACLHHIFYHQTCTSCQMAFTLSKVTIEILEQGVNIFKLNSKLLEFCQMEGYGWCQVNFFDSKFPPA